MRRRRLRSRCRSKVPTSGPGCHGSEPPDRLHTHAQAVSPSVRQPRTHAHTLPGNIFRCSSLPSPAQVLPPSLPASLPPPAHSPRRRRPRQLFHSSPSLSPSYLRVAIPSPPASQPASLCAIYVTRPATDTVTCSAFHFHGLRAATEGLSPSLPLQSPLLDSPPSLPHCLARALPHRKEEAPPPSSVAQVSSGPSGTGLVPALPLFLALSLLPLAPNPSLLHACMATALVSTIEDEETPGQTRRSGQLLKSCLLEA